MALLRPKRATGIVLLMCKVVLRQTYELQHFKRFLSCQVHADHGVKGGEGDGSSSAAASGSSSAQDQQRQQASAAHDHQHLSRAAAALLAPGLAPTPAPPPANTHHNTIPPPVSYAMLVDNTLQQPVPAIPAASQPPSFSPVATRYKEKFRQFVDRERPVLPPLAEVPALPVGDASAAFQSFANGVNTLIAGVNEIRSELKDNVKIKDLQEFREMQSDEFKEMIAVQTEPLRAAVDDNTCRIDAIEAEMKNLKVNSDEAARKRMLDDTDAAFKQIAFTGFKDAGKANDLVKRIALLKQFAATHFSQVSVANVETIKNGPWKQRKPTGTVVMEFFSRDARDEALALAKSKPVMDGGTKLEIKIDRARTRAQRARNWALRKAEELAKIEAQRRGISGTPRIDFTMPVRRVYIGDELAFAQTKDELRGTFVDVFAACVLPP